MAGQRWGIHSSLVCINIHFEAERRDADNGRKELLGHSGVRRVTTVYLLVGLWVVFNLLAPYAVLLKAEPISWGRLPAELLTAQRDKRVKFYITTLKGSYGYSVFSPIGLHLVIFDKNFFSRASPACIRFVISHELGHYHLRHHQKRWLLVVTGLVLLPAIRRWLQRMEDEADVEAARRTGLVREMFPELG